MAQIRERYESLGVVAYSCKVVDSAPQGGHVIAVQKKIGYKTEDVRTYMREFKKQHPDRTPVCYFCLDGSTAYGDTKDAAVPADLLPIEEKENQQLENQQLKALLAADPAILAKTLTIVILRLSVDWHEKNWGVTFG